MQQRKLNRDDQIRFKEEYGHIYDVLYNTRPETYTGYHYNWEDTDLADASEEDREKFFEKLWAKGGFAFFLANYRDVLVKKEANDIVYDFWRRKTIARIHDPDMQEKLGKMLLLLGCGLMNSLLTCN